MSSATVRAGKSSGLRPWGPRGDLDGDGLKEPFLVDVGDVGVVEPAMYWRRVALLHAKDHQRYARRNGRWFHLLTVGGMVVSAAAAAVPVDDVARVCGGIATVLIGLMRSLDLGNRWRWHRTMDAGYTVLSQHLRDLSRERDPLKTVGRLAEQVIWLESTEDQLPGIGPPASMTTQTMLMPHEPEDPRRARVPQA
ncbi:hypothetical protein [Streptomyces sp. KL118A]|uniref:hypothetical protein n=1 Tax=Streptomyces sp. KL118A TaxID=3045153 RepID=UPI00278C663F|nr:hypothetical protein [Streptomyces sp. KL118A]